MSSERAGAAMVAAGGGHNCAVARSGSVLCWGGNAFGQLGDGSNNSASKPVVVPTFVPESSDVTSVASGSSHSCALMLDGTVMCWGDNGSSQLGDGTTNPSSTPVAVIGVSNAVKVAAGLGFTCALIADGTVKCWGEGVMGQLGDGNGTASSAPVTVAGLTNASNLAVGQMHACVIASGSVRCWGTNLSGQLGDGTTSQANSPTTVSGVSGATRISAGAAHSCAVTATNVKCWGANESGQLGDGTTVTPRTTAVTVGALTSPSAVAAGGTHTCAVDATPAVKCWGAGASGQLGNGASSPSSTPVTVSTITSASSLSASGDHTCGIEGGGTFVCWGGGAGGEIGDGGTSNRNAPATVLRTAGGKLMAAGASHSCTALSGGKVNCWGLNGSGQLGDTSTSTASSPVVAYNLFNLASITAGTAHSCAVEIGGQAKCWGSNSSGQLGRGSSSPSYDSLAGNVSSLTNAVAIDAGSNFNCALTTAATLRCWGQGGNYQLGNGGNSNSNSPVSVSGVSNAIAVTAGGTTACTIVTGGQAKCWGDNSSGQVGQGNTTTPVTAPANVSGVTTATAIANGANHSCAILADTTVKCWGANNYGQVGDGTTTTPRSTPVAVSGLSGATAIAVGDYHTCAIVALGAVKCWGYGANGRLGNSGTGNSSTPADVTGMLGAVSIATGGQHTCAVIASGATYCWGYGLNSALGNGSTSDRTYPVESEKVLEALVSIPSPAEGEFTQTTQPPIDFNTIDVVSPLVECNLDYGGWNSCGFSPFTPGSPLSIGRHTMQIRAAPSLYGSDVISYTSLSFAVSVVLPTASIGSPADGAVTSDNTPSVSFGATGEGALTIECRADSGSWTTCASPWTSGVLTDGLHSLQVKVTDANTNVATAAVNVTIDTAPPDTAITANPPSLSNSSSASFSFSATETSTFECRLDAGGWSSCSSPNNLSGLPSGSHTFYVRATDTAGNTDASPASYTWTVDTTPPDTTITTNPPSLTTSAAASFSFSATETATFECRLDAGGYGSCASPQAYSSLTDGSHTFYVRATDSAGNLDATPASYTWTIDTTPPDTTISATPPALSTSADASFSFSAGETATYECRLDAGGYSSCTSPRNYSALADGSHTFYVRATDSAGNLDATPASYSWTIDTVPPDTTITANPPSLSTSASASFSFSAGETATFECRFDAGGYSSCASPQAYSSLTDGSHTFYVRATDSAGNLDATPASYSWTIDTTPPDTSISANPPALSTSADASFSFSASETATFECRLDGGGYGSCTSPRNYSSLADGPHTFYVRATDSAGNLDATPASYTWTVDAAVPETTIDAGPPSTSNSGTASFSFSANETATFQCRLDGATWGACTSPRNYSSLADGPHTFEVRATDTAGNTDATPASQSWTIDTVAPDTSVNGGPPALTNGNSAAFSFSATETSSFQCRLDGGGYGACTSPHGLSGLADGPHTFYVRATDAAGNTDATPASYSWTIDTTPPDTTITSNPSALSTSASAAFSFSAFETATFECRIDGGGYGACTSPHGLSGLADGPHTFYVRATDAAGNTDATSASYSWTIDTTPPDTTITSNPSALSTSASAAFSFSASETATFECRIDGGGYGACTSPRNYSSLADGPHTFYVRATDGAGNPDASPAFFSWTIDTVPPDTSISATPPLLTNQTSASFNFTGSGGATSFQCSKSGSAWSSCTSPQAYSSLAAGTHVFAVRAIDDAGNIDPTPASYTWNVDLTAPDTTITAQPPAMSASDAASFSFSATETATYECRLDGGGYGSCTSPHNYSSLADGPHTFYVRSTDGAGNTDATPASYAWSVDTTDPNVQITSPSGGSTIGDSTPEIAFTASDANGVSVDCRVDTGSWSACSSPFTTPSLADGAHTVDVRATDPAGNIATANVGFTVDSSFPTVTVTAPAAGSATSDDTPSLTFTPAGSAPLTIECAVDGGAFAACASGDSLASLADGQHTATVRVTDGLARVVTADRTFTVDTVAPSPVFSSPADGASVSATAVSVAFSFTDATAVTATCSLDGGASGSCSSPFDTGPLSEGAHGVTVTLTDAAGNSDSGTVNFTVDRTAPVTTISAPADGATVTTATAPVDFASVDAGVVTHECAVDGGSYLACVSPYVPSLSAGAHTVSVRGTDAAGNSATDSVTFTFSPPAPPPSSPPSSPPASPPAGPQIYAATLTAKKKGAKLKLTLKLTPPAGVSAACAGTVGFSGKLVRTKVKASGALTTLSGSCVVSRTVKVKKTLKGKLKLTAKFPGSAQISPLRVARTFKVK